MCPCFTNLIRNKYYSRILFWIGGTLVCMLLSSMIFQGSTSSSKYAPRMFFIFNMQLVCVISLTLPLLSEVLSPVGENHITRNLWLKCMHYAISCHSSYKSVGDQRTHCIWSLPAFRSNMPTVRLVYARTEMTLCWTVLSDIWGSISSEILP